MKKLLIAVAAVIALVVVALLVVYGYLRSTLPEYDGAVEVAGLHGKLEILRDGYGMPHIYADDGHDLAFGLGYAMAQDRLFQMDLVRRATRGRLSEVLGAATLGADKFFLTLTAAKPVDALFADSPPEVRTDMAAFAEGVNAFLTQRQGALPLEFALLGYQPEPWQPSDGAAVYYYMAWDLNCSFDIELLYMAVADKVGDALAADLFVDYPAGRGTILPQGTTTQAFLDQLAAARQVLGVEGGGNSNSWVVSGARTETGAPLLANDMHLGHGLPGIWYEAHLVTPETNVSGVVLPGIPYVVVGATERVAWGFTNVMADDSDYYLEKIDTAQPNRYEHQGEWREMEVVEHQIAVKGQPPVPYTVRRTLHGPLIDDVHDIDAPDGFAVAMRWTAPELAGAANAVRLFNSARSVEDMERAVAHFKCPGQNIVYADVEGHIGYWAAVGIPLRPGFSGARPLPGWDGAHEWQGFAPTEEQPHLRDPAEGYVVSANNRHVGDGYPHAISYYYATPDRFERIDELLRAEDKLGADDFARIHMDQHLLMGREWTPRLLRAITGEQLGAVEAAAREVMEGWDYDGGAGQVAPTIFHATLNALLRNVYQPRLGPELYRHYIGNAYVVFNSLRSLLAQPASPWFDDPGTPVAEDEAAQWRAAFKQGVAALEASLGPEVRSWRWGRLHTLTLEHPFGKQSPLLARLLNRGPHAMGGSFGSVNPTPYRLRDPWSIHHGASMRYIFDLKDLRRSQRVIPAGISGNFMSPHYDDQLPLWLAGTYRPFRLDREGVDAEVRHRLQLIPD